MSHKINGPSHGSYGASPPAKRRKLEINPPNQGITPASQDDWTTLTTELRTLRHRLLQSKILTSRFARLKSQLVDVIREEEKSLGSDFLEANREAINQLEEAAGAPTWTHEDVIQAESLVDPEWFKIKGTMEAKFMSSLRGYNTQVPPEVPRCDFHGTDGMKEIQDADNSDEFDFLLSDMCSSSAVEGQDSWDSSEFSAFLENLMGDRSFDRARLETPGVDQPQSGNLHSDSPEMEPGMGDELEGILEELSRECVREMRPIQEKSERLLNLGSSQTYKCGSSKLKHRPSNKVEKILEEIRTESVQQTRRIHKKPETLLRLESRQIFNKSGKTDCEGPINFGPPSASNDAASINAATKVPNLSCTKSSTCEYAKSRTDQRHKVNVGDYYVLVSDPRYFEINWDEQFTTTLFGSNFACTTCPFETTSRPLMEDHVWSKHFNGAYNCPFCNHVVIGRRYTMRNHIKCHHSGRSFR